MPECFRRYDDVLAELVAVSWLLFVYSSAVLGGVRFTASTSTWLSDAVELLAPAALIIVAHEAVHAAVLAVEGIGVEFGVSLRGRLPVAYTRPKRPVPREKYFAVSLAPLAAFHVIPLMGLVTRLPLWAKYLFIYNTAGSSGDILAALSALRLPRGSEVLDTGDGFGACMPHPLGRRGKILLYLAAVATLVAAAI